MKKIFKFFFIIGISTFFLHSCSSVKDGLTENKRTNADEFLVEKKNPLVLPPKFDELPKPGTTESINEVKKSTEGKVSIEDKIKKEINRNKKSKNDQTVSGSIEESILEKIKTN